MTAAQARFRRLIALYPAQWQASHGEAYLGVMLDVADAEGRTGPTARERLSALRHAGSVWRRELARRGAGDPAVASLRWVGPAGLVAGSVLAVLCLTLGEVPGLFAPTGMPGATWMLVLAPLWLVALGAALAGRSRAARRLLAVVAALPVPALAVAVSQLGGATDASGATVRLFPTAARVVQAVLDAGWVEAATSARPPLLVVAVSSACAAAAAAAGPARSVRGRRLTAGLVGAGLLGTAVAVVLAGGPGHGWTLYLGGFDSLLPAVAVLTAAVTLAGVALLVRRPGVLLSVAVLGWPWAVAFVVTRTGSIAGLHVFPWSVEALLAMLVPGAFGALVAGAVAVQRLRARSGAS